MEKVVRDFVHEHPLTFCEEEYDDDYKPNSICSMCTLPILSSPSYACPTCADFFLHQPCAQLPKRLPFPRDPRYVYSLNPTPSDTECRKCKLPIQNLAYSLWGEDIHPLCAKPVEIKIKKHKSHPQHPLVAIHKNITCRCDACGEKHEGIFFSCVECSFLIHRDCALSPSIVKHVSHPHLLILTYALYNLYAFKSSSYCGCCKKLLYGEGFYFCGQCPEAFHMKCVSSNVEILNFESQQEYWIHLPSERDRFPENSIKRISKYINDDDRMNCKLQKIVKCHNNHPLEFQEKYPSSSSNVIAGDEDDEEEDDDDELLVCNGCAQSISKTSPIVGCFKPDCNFLLHHFCATNLPSQIENYYMENRLTIVEPGNSKDFFYSIFFCYLCGRPCNGFGCFVEDYPSHICIECALSPKTATHESHHGVGQHVLFISNPEYKTVKHASCCSSEYFEKAPLIYCCVTCEFRIHIGCALLPKKVRHKFDKHPLELVFTNDEKCFKKLLDCCFCEFCEEDIDQRYWFYRCVECDQSFHVKCIPLVGFLSNVKFGGSLNVPIHPRHPVILTRMLMEGNQRCARCKKIIKGFEDDMAFRCDHCDFWIHFKCARDCCFERMYGHVSLCWDEVQRYGHARGRWHPYST